MKHHLTAITPYPVLHRCLLLGFLFLTGTTLLITLHAQENSAGVGVENATVRAVPPNSSATAAFMTLVNDTDKPARLVGGSAPFAGMAGPMITTHELHDGKMAMGTKDVPFLKVTGRTSRQVRQGAEKEVGAG